MSASSPFVLIARLAVAVTISGATVSSANAQEPEYIVVVTPKGWTGTAARAYSTNGHAETFYVYNVGNVADTYTISCSGAVNVTCTGTSISSVALGPGTFTTVDAFFNVGATGTGYLYLQATGFSSDQGSFVVPVVVPTYQPAVTPDGASQWAGAPSSSQTTFTIQNNGNLGTVTYQISVPTCSAPVQSCVADSTTVTVPQGGTRSVKVSFSATAVLGTGTIALRATHAPSGNYDEGSVAIPTTTSSLDDVLPYTTLSSVYSLLPGALPLPHDSLKGCPRVLDDPEIRLKRPFTYVTQPGFDLIPTGRIYMAETVWGTTFDIAAVWRDYVSSDQQTCAGSTWLTEGQYRWEHWAHSPVPEPLWTNYPYADRSGATGSAVGIVDPFAIPMQEHSTGGNIDVNSYKVWLNGNLIINNGTPVSGVTLVSISATASTYTVSTTLANKYDLLNPASNNGGWNELKASIADLSGRRTTIRARFVVVGPGVAKTLRVAGLRDFRQLSQDECAGFGSFQCGGVMLAQTIPGLVTRDKDRSTHLVYRSTSQRAPTILPFQLSLDRLQAAPDSIHVEAFDASGVVSVGRAMRYQGTRVTAGTPVVSSSDTLRQNASEERVLGAEVSAPSGIDAAIRQLKVRVRGFYSTGPIDTLVTQEVVQLHLTDTASTRFGPGWQLGEISRLILGQSYQGASAAIWVLGDGSYVIFKNAGGANWTTPVGETTRLLDSTATTGRFVVALANGTSIGYSASGRIEYTADLLGNKTTFGYAAAAPETRLIQIVDPNGAKTEFLYNAANAPGQVSDVVLRTAAGAATTVASLAYDGATKRLRKVTMLRSPMPNDSTVFVYETASPYGAYVDTILDPRHTTANPIRFTFVYDSLFATPRSNSRPPVDGISNLSAEIREPWRRALPRVGRGVGLVPLERTVLAAQVKGIHNGFGGASIDYTVDAFGGPTFVRQATAFPFGAGALERRIVRDSLGRVLRIVRAADQPSIADSVVYRYDAFNRLDRIIRNALAHPVGATPLDTITFTYDSVTFASGQRCHRMRSMKDAMGGFTRTNYDSLGAGIRPCLPIRAIGLAPGDTTKFFYGLLTLGDPATSRPVRTEDPNGLQDSVEYDAVTWNSKKHVRKGDMATTTAYWSGLGRLDMMVDADGRGHDYRYDQSGRILKTKSGGNSGLSPTVANFYRDGVLDSTRVYRSDGSGGIDDPPYALFLQTHRSRFNRLGWVDTTITPGGRKIAFKHDLYGNARWEYPGNSTWINRVFDTWGRLVSEEMSQVDSDHPQVPGQTFAPEPDQSIYESFGLAPTYELHPGADAGFGYNVKGQLVYSVSIQKEADADSTIVHRRGYSRSGALTADTMTFMNGLRSILSYEYNRRGQRTSMRDTSFLTNGETFENERGGRTQYFYTTATARLDSTVATTGTLKVGKVRFIYDKGGRDSVRIVRLGSGSGYAADSMRTAFTYDAAGRMARMTTTRGPDTWYDFNATAPGSFNAVDEILTHAAVVPNATGGISSHTKQFEYSNDGTRRLWSSSRSDGGGADYDWIYDVFGNRLTESSFWPTAGCAEHYNSASTFGSDNKLTYTEVTSSCPRKQHYWHDNAGNRLAQVDTAGSNEELQSIMTYTARAQLYYSEVRAATLNTLDCHWHWYGPDGKRVLTHTRKTSPCPGAPSLTAGSRMYYVYDGDNVALVVARIPGTPVKWFVRQRYLSVGLDEAVAGRFTQTVVSTPYNLALVTDRQGTPLTALNPATAWTYEPGAKMWVRDAFGGQEQTGGSDGTINTETGFTGASTPNQSGGFTYLRNRWYDPRTGRFLTQDPIGLAGGVNLYSYAGNNPIAYTEPYGLCVPMPFCLRGVVGEVGEGLEQGLRAGGDVGVGSTPVASTVHDAITAVTGHNYVTGDKVGLGGRLVAAAGVVTPVGGGQIRGLLKAGKHALSKGLLRVTAAFSDGALRRVYHGAIAQINRHKEILSKASPEQVNSITKDIVKHEKQLQAAVEEMQRRGVEP